MTSARLPVTKRFRSATAVAGIAVALAALATPASADGGGGANNVVQVVTRADDQFRHKAQVQAVPFGGESAQSTNLARAESRDCSGCRTHAAALQAVFLTGNPDTVQPANAAVATNVRCPGCVTYAYAFQYVLTTDGPVALSPEGHERIAHINQEADAVVAQQLPPDQIEAQLDALFTELKNVVDGELRAKDQVAVARTVRERDVAGE